MTHPAAPQSAICLTLATSDKMTLRPFAQGDLPALVRLFHEPAVREFLWDDELVAQETVAEVIAGSEADFAAGRCGFFSLWHSDRELVGFCGLRPFAVEALAGGLVGLRPEWVADADAPPEQGVACVAASELLYGLLPQFWGKGVVSAACRAVLDWAVNEAQITRVIAATDPPNVRSIKVMERLSMTPAGRGKYHGLDTIFYTLDHHQLTALAARGE